MTDVAVRLLVDNKAFVSGMDQASGQLSKFGSDGDRAAAAAERLSGAVARVGHYAVALAGISGLSQTVSGVIKLTDEFASLQGRMSLVIDSSDKVAAAQRQLFGIAQETRTGLAGLSEIFVKLTQSTEGSGVSQARLMGITKTMGQALALSGGSAESMKAALVQLGQGMASGTLRGEELNAVIEQTPALAKAIADGLGITIGALREMGQEGKISSELIVRALEASATSVDANFKKLPLTIGQAMTQIQNSLLQAVGVFDQANGLSGGLARSISLLAQNMDVLAAAGVGLAVMMAGRMLPAMAQSVAATLAERAAKIASLQATVASTEARAIYTGMVQAEAAATLASARGLGASIVAQNAAIASSAAHTAAVAAQTVAQTALAKATSIASLALGVVGGPIGLITTALSLGATAWMLWGSRSEEASNKSKTAVVNDGAEVLAQLKKENDALERKMSLLARSKLTLEQLTPAEELRLNLTAKFNALAAASAPNEAAEILRREQLRIVTTELAGVTAEIERATSLKTAAGKADGSMDAELIAIRNKLNGVDENYVKTLLSLEKMRKAGYISGTEYSELVDQLAAKQNKLGEASKRAAQEAAKGATEMAKVTREYEEQSDAIADKIAALDAEAKGSDKLNDAEVMRLKVYRDFGDKYSKWTADQRTKIAQDLTEWDAKIKLSNAAKEAARVSEEEYKAKQKAGDEAERLAEKIEAELAKLNEENATLMYTKEQLAAMSDERLSAQIAIAQQIVAQDELLLSCNQETEAHKRTLQALLDLKDARGEKGYLQAAKDAADAWGKVSEQIGQGLTDSLFRAFESGKGFFKTLWNGIVNTFKTTVLRLGVEAVMKGSGLTAAFAGASGANAGTLGGGAGDLLSLASSAGSLMGIGSSVGAGMGVMGTLGSGVAAGFGTGMAGLSGGAGMLSGAIGAGSATGALGGAGMMLGALGPYALAATAIYAIYNKFKHERTPHTGGAAMGTALESSGVNWKDVTGLGKFNIDYDDKANAGMVSLSKSVAALIQPMADLVGAGTVRAGTAFADDKSKDSAWGAFRVTAGSRTLADWGGTRKDFGDGEKGFKAFVQAIADDTRGAIESLNLPAWARGITGALRDGATLDDIAAAVTAITQTSAALRVMSDTLDPLGGVFSRVASLSGDAAIELAGFAGGMDSLIGKAQGYVSSFYTEGERASITASGIVDALSAAGVSADFSSKDEFRAMVDNIGVSTTTERQQLAALLNVASDFASLSSYMEASGLSLRQLADSMAESSVAAAALGAAQEAERQNTNATIIAQGEEQLAYSEATSAGVQAMGGQIGHMSNRLANAISALQASLEAGMAAVAANTAQTARQLSTWDDGGALVTTPAP